MMATVVESIGRGLGREKWSENWAMRAAGCADRYSVGWTEGLGEDFGMT
jgi:hypothetical protein